MRPGPGITPEFPQRAGRGKALEALPRIVLDTNVLLRAFVSEQSAAARVLMAAENRRCLALLSRAVLGEYAAVLTDSELVARFPNLSSSRVGATLGRLCYYGEYFPTVTTHFEFSRDPRDAKFIELAIAGRASHIISFDRDLLSLIGGHGESARRFRQRLQRTEILSPAEFLARRTD